MKMIVNIKKLDKRAVLPSYGSDFAAGADLYALTDGDVIIEPGETKLIHTGIAAQIPLGYAGLVYARSGLASKNGLAPANKVGVIDCDYRGEIMVALHNHSQSSQTVSCFQRIAQMVITPYITGEFIQTDELSDTVRGAGGFGSTGKN
jgi:dUTP pyrophosphatase